MLMQLADFSSHDPVNNGEFTDLSDFNPMITKSILQYWQQL